MFSRHYLSSLRTADVFPVVAYVRCSQATICLLHNCFWNRYWERAGQLLGTLRSNDATATRTSLKKWICVLFVFIAIIPTYSLCQVHANPPEFEFQRTIFKFRKRNKISSLPVYVLHKTRNWAFSRCSRSKTAKKCTKKRDARTKLFCLLNLLFFRRSRCHRVAKVPNGQFPCPL